MTRGNQTILGQSIAVTEQKKPEVFINGEWIVAVLWKSQLSCHTFQFRPARLLWKFSIYLIAFPPHESHANTIYLFLQKIRRWKWSK